MSASQWMPGSIIYQIFPDRFFNGDLSNDPRDKADWDDTPTRNNFFGGDLAGIAQKLDYVQQLGANTIYLTPVFSAPSNHKYDTRDYYQVDPIFGGNQALSKLVVAIHARGMKLILDGVFNHCGEEFYAFQDLLAKGKESKYANWFFPNAFPLTKEPLNYMCCGDASSMPKFNHANPQVEEYLLSVGEFWLRDFSIDGWRLDVPFKVPFKFWEKFRKAVKAVNPDLFLFGEIWRDATRWVDGTTFDGVTNYRLRDLIIDFCKTKVLDAEDYLYESTLLRQSLGEAAYDMVNLLGSHDTPRILSIFENDTRQTILAWVLMLTEVGIPLIYYGDEVGMAGGQDPDCRRTMVWDDQQQNKELLAVIQSIVALRRETDVLGKGSFEALFAFIGTVAFRRSYADKEIIVIVNTRDALRNIRVPVGYSKACYFNYQSKEKVNVVEGGLVFELIPPSTYMIMTSF